jgi:hypothetical protein
VIPKGWSEHHRPVPAGASTATVTVTRAAAGGTWDASTGTVTGGDSSTIHAGTARIQALLRQPTSPDAAGQTISARDYLVVVNDITVDIRKGDRVHVDTSEDPNLTGRDLTVDEVQRGSLVWERDLTCVLDAANTP